MLIVAKEFISMSSSFKSLDHILSCYNNVPSSDTATDAIQVPHITSWSSSSSDSDEDAVNDEYVTRITPMLIPVCFKNETTSKRYEHVLMHYVVYESKNIYKIILKKKFCTL